MCIIMPEENYLQAKILFEVPQNKTRTSITHVAAGIHETGMGKKTF